MWNLCVLGDVDKKKRDNYAKHLALDNGKYFGGNEEGTY